jgi:hypothetical protein
MADDNLKSLKKYSWTLNGAKIKPRYDKPARAVRLKQKWYRSAQICVTVPGEAAAGAARAGRGGGPGRAHPRLARRRGRRPCPSSEARCPRPRAANTTNPCTTLDSLCEDNRCMMTMVRGQRAGQGQAAVTGARARSKLRDGRVLQARIAARPSPPLRPPDGRPENLALSPFTLR